MVITAGFPGPEVWKCWVPGIQWLQITELLKFTKTTSGTYFVKQAQQLTYFGVLETLHPTCYCTEHQDCTEAVSFAHSSQATPHFLFPDGIPDTWRYHPGKAWAVLLLEVSLQLLPKSMVSLVVCFHDSQSQEMTSLPPSPPKPLVSLSKILEPLYLKFELYVTSPPAAAAAQAACHANFARS